MLRNNKQQSYICNCEGLTIKGQALQVIEQLENLGQQALKTGDIVKSHSFFQHAEHYKREINAR
jgi:hypothetical protein